MNFQPLTHRTEHRVCYPYITPVIPKSDNYPVEPAPSEVLRKIATAMFSHHKKYNADVMTINQECQHCPSANKNRQWRRTE